MCGAPADFLSLQIPQAPSIPHLPSLRLLTTLASARISGNQILRPLPLTEDAFKSLQLGHGVCERESDPIL